MGRRAACRRPRLFSLYSLLRSTVFLAPTRGRPFNVLCSRDIFRAEARCASQFCSASRLQSHRDD
eukprot:7815165-Pyramimonas_sp.AAC.1